MTGLVVSQVRTYSSPAHPPLAIMQKRVAAAAKKKTRTIEAGEGVVGGRAAALPKKKYPLGHLKPLFNGKKCVVVTEVEVGRGLCTV